MGEIKMTLDEALIILSEGNARGKLRIARACGDMIRAQTQAMRIARECIKRCRDFQKIREADTQRDRDGQERQQDAFWKWREGEE